MSRYLLLIIFTSPFVVLGTINAVVQYKTKKISQLRYILYLTFWITILTGLVFAEPTYQWLAKSNLTESDSLSLFDVIQITAIILLLYTVNRINSRASALEAKVKDLHQEISIITSEDKST